MGVEEEKTRKVADYIHKNIKGLGIACDKTTVSIYRYAVLFYAKYLNAVSDLIDNEEMDEQQARDELNKIVKYANDKIDGNFSELKALSKEEGMSMQNAARVLSNRRAKERKLLKTIFEEISDDKK